MKYSVIIPAYNVENYIVDAIESIIAQNYSNLELIIVNDGSNDGTGAICHKYCKNYNWIKVVDKENGGVSSARNAGISLARGEYIYFLDGDDTMMSNVFNKIDVNEIADVYFSTHMMTHNMESNLNNDRIVIDAEKTSKLNPNEMAAEIILCNGSLCASIWSTKIIKGNNFLFNEGTKIGEDDEWQEKTINACKKITLIDFPCFVYNLMRTDSATTSPQFLALLSGMAAYEKLVKKYEVYEGYKKSQLLQRFSSSYWNIARKCFRKNVVISKKELSSIKVNKKTLSYTNFKSDKLNRLCVKMLGFKLGMRCTNWMIAVFSKKS